MTYAYDLGFAYGVYLHGADISVGVSEWSDASGKLCDDQITVGGINRRSFPFKYAGQPNVVDRFVFTLVYNGVQSQADLTHLQYVRSVGGRLDVCLYKRTTETWSADVAFTSVTTQRRLALRTLTAAGYTLPTGAVTDLAEIARAGAGLSVLTEGAGAGGYEIGTADADGHVPITIGTATTLFTFAYVPLIYMVDASFAIAAIDKLGEQWTISLREAV